MKTMMMKLGALLTVVCLFAAPAVADFSGGRVWYDRIAGGDSTDDDYFRGNGGEFTLRHDGAPWLLSNALYHANTKAQDGNDESFQTFCVETLEFVAQPMDAIVSTTWVSGNRPQWDVNNDRFPQSHAVKGSEDSGDDLNPQTAFLYWHFAKGDPNAWLGYE